MKRALKEGVSDENYCFSDPKCTSGSHKYQFQDVFQFYCGTLYLGEGSMDREEVK